MEYLNFPEDFSSRLIGSGTSQTRGRRLEAQSEQVDVFLAFGGIFLDFLRSKSVIITPHPGSSVRSEYGRGNTGLGRSCPHGTAELGQPCRRPGPSGGGPARGLTSGTATTDGCPILTVPDWFFRYSEHYINRNPVRPVRADGSTFEQNPQRDVPVV